MITRDERWSQASGLHPSNHPGLTLRQAALTAGVSMLVMTAAAPFAEFFVFHKLIHPGNIEGTVQNIVAHRELFCAGILAFLLNYILDVIISWAFYILLTPANPAISLLTAMFRLVYTAIGASGLLKLVSTFHLVTAPDNVMAFGSQQVNAEAKLLLNSFRSDWSVGLVFFGIHLILLGWLVYRSRYIPRLIGLLLVINGLAWMATNVQPYLYPTANLDFLFVTYFGELVFMAWLLIRGWAIKE